MSKSRLVRAGRVARSRYRRWLITRRRLVPAAVPPALRRVGLLLVVLGLVAQTVVVWEGPATASSSADSIEFLDRFSSGGFSGSDGSASWSQDPWHEVGEADGPDVGAIRVVADGGCATGSCLVIDGGGVAVGIERPVPLGRVARSRISLTYTTSTSAGTPVDDDGTQSEGGEPSEHLESNEALDGSQANVQDRSTDLDEQGGEQTDENDLAGIAVSDGGSQSIAIYDLWASTDGGDSWSWIATLDPAAEGNTIDLPLFKSPEPGAVIKLTTDAPVGSSISIEEVEVSGVVENHAPRAGKDEADVEAGSTVFVDVLGNDVDDDDDSLVVQIDRAPDHGSAVVLDGMIRYEAPAEYDGRVDFRYSVTDTYGATDQAKVTVTVRARSTDGAGVDNVRPSKHVEGERDRDKAGLPMAFEQNQGQTDEAVDFLARGQGYQVFLSGGDAVIALGSGGSGHAIRMDLVGAEPSPPAEGIGLLPGRINYFVGDDPSQWQTDVKTYAAVEYQSVYSGIDFRYYGNDQHLEYDFIVRPGGDPGVIALAFDGSTSLELDEAGDLVIGLNPGRTVSFSAPVSYQDVDGTQVPVDSSYVLDGDTVSFVVGDYDPSLPLVIDPTLQYGSYLGGTGTDSGSAIVLDGSGNMVIGGYSASSDFPVTVGAYDQSANSNNDVTVTKLSADGSTLLWSTYLGGSGLDNANDIAIDGSGAVYVGVYTASSNFPTTAGAFDTSLAGLYDGAVAKLSANGASLLYSTYLGGSGANDYLRAIAVDASGQAVVAGATDSSNFPMVGGSYDTSFGGSFDAFVTKINTTGTGLVWSTYIGGTGSDGADDLVLDGSGTVYLTGQAASGFPTTAGAYDSTVGGTFDGHATKLSADGSTLLYATVFGGSASDVARAIAVADANTLFVGGDTPSSDFPTTAGAYDTTKSSSDDMFVLSLDLTQTGSAQLAYSTFIGGSGFDRVTGIAVDGANRAHVAGWTQSSGLATAGAYDTTLGGSSDAVLAILSADGSTMEELTYVGGDAGDSANDVHLSGSSIYLTGSTSSAAGFPITAGAYQSSSLGTSDGFVVRFAALDAPPDPSVVTVNSTGDASDNNPGDDVCDTGGTVGSDPECTLRAAIEEANASATVDTIHFGIPTSDSGYSASPLSYTIQVGVPSTEILPAITAPVMIDGTSQPGYPGAPIIVLDGTATTTPDTNGITLEAGNSTIRGLSIVDFPDDGIEVDIAGGNTVAGNYVGVLPDGSTASGNGWGIAVKSSGNTIGGTTAADRNVVAGNGNYGLSIYNGSSGNIVTGNYIGVGADGSTALGNGAEGVRLEAGANVNTIGGIVAGARNVISANGTDGIYLQDAATDGNVIQGNYIGTDATGLLDRGNADRGVQVESGADNTVIGGTAPGAGNVISGNGNDGIVIGDGASPGTGTTGTVVQGNLIGVGADGTTPLGNDAHGVHITTVDANLIGGTSAGAGNTIAHNTWTGVLVQNSTASDNSILGNAIHSNGGVGIDLGDNGATNNDSGDGDSGANDLLNFPVISSATEVGGTVTVTFDLDVPANPDQYRVEFFANPSGADGSGNGEGEIYLSSTTTAPGTGITHTFAGSTGDVITATATRIDTGATSGLSSTSEFSAAATVTGDPLAPELWLSTAADVGSPSGVSALDSWSAGALLGFGDPGLALGSGTTGGTMSLVEDFDAQGQDGNVVLIGLHQVQSTITVGTSPSITLQSGDLLFSVANNETFVNSDLSTTAIADKDVGLFRPDTPGDYSAGTFSVLLDQPLGSGSAVSLVETETVLPDITLAAGTFLLTDAKIVYRLIPTGTGDGIPPGTPTVLQNGPDVGLDKNLTAIDLVEDWLVVATTALPPGTLLISMDGEDTVGSNNLSTTRRDVFALTLSATTAGSGTGAGTAEPFFVGTDVGLDSNEEAVSGFSIVGGVPATAPVAYDDSVGATQDASAIVRPLDNDVDPNGDPLSIDSFTQGSNGTVTDNGDDTVTYTPNPGWTGVDTFTYTITDGTGTDTGTVTVTVTPHSDPMAIYRRSGQDAPRYQTWDGSAFGGELTSATVGEFRIIQGAESPGRDEAIVVGVDNVTGTIAGELWDGSSWTALPALGSTTQNYWWSFDVAYEAVSGDGVVVYADGANLNYRVWNGSTWSAEASISEPLAGTPRQMQLASHPWADEMVLIVSDDTSQDYALVWDGSAWGNPVTLHSGGAGDRTDVYVAYEQQSGRAMVTYGKGTDDVYYRLWDGSWGSESMLAGINGGYARWTTLASDPNSNNIVIGVLENNADVWLAVWNGAGWMNQITATATGSGTTHPVVAVGFEGTSGQALAAYSGMDATPEYRTWTSGSGWSAQANAPDVGANPNSVMLYPNPQTDGIMLATQDANSDLNYSLWNGSAWGSVTELTTNTGETKNQPFLFLWNAAPNSVPIPVATDDAASTLVDTSVVVDVVANDTDPIGGGLTIDSVTQGTNGTVTNNGTDLTYTPNASFIGTDTFTYTVSDSNGGTDTATVTINVLEPVVLDNIQKGTTTIASGSSSTTATITAVDPSKAFLTFTVRGDQPTPNDMMISGELTNATTVTFSRAGTFTNVTIEWSVVEFVSGVSVQRGSPTLGSSTTDIPISSVDLTRSFVLMNSRVGGGTFGASDFPRAALTSSTNLRVSIESSASNVVKWQVVTYNEAAVQRGTTSFASGDSSKTATVSTVDTSKAWLLYSNTTTAGTANDIGQKLVRGLVTSGTTLTFDRSSTGQSLDVAWELVEFTDATDVQHASVAFSSSVTSQDVSITAVNPARSIAVGGTTLYGGRSSYAGDDNPGVGWFTTKLTTPTNLRVQRNTAPALADLGWFVIQWPGVTAPSPVNSTGDGADTAPGDGYCTTGGTNSAGDPECTLRAAIQEANATPGADTITFDMPATESGHSAGVWTISPGSQYPTITEAVTIDASTQTGYTSTPVVELNGTGAGASSDGLRVFSPNVEIRGFAINRFGADGIEVDTASTGGGVIAGNHIGLDPSGLIDRGNGGKGIDLQTGSGPTTVGGTAAADRNVISGNGLEGIIVWGTDGNTIIGNYIGTDVTGNAPIPNTNDGLHVGNGADNNIFGQAGAGNVISGNGNDGIEIDDVSGGNVIHGNTIGLGADGSTVVANGRYGVVLYNGANTTQIGGSGAGDRNVISGNVSAGVVIDGNANGSTAGNVITGNLIGTDSTGTLDRGNGTYGVYLFAGAVNAAIGGTATGAGNTISGNGSHGIFIEDAGTVGTLIEGNLIGLTQAGDAALGNTGNGIEIDWEVPNQLIGGSTPGAGNVISANLNGIHSLWANDMVIEGNIVGLDVTGTVDLGNTAAGIRVGGDNVVIGGTTAGARNVVSGNGNAGIMLDSATSAVLQGNYIGTDITGLLDRGNSSNGVYVSGTGNQIGGSVAGAGNLISGNTNDGVQTSGGSTGTVFEGNTIGLGSDGSTPLPNSYRGISIYGTGTRVGGTNPAASNTISGNFAGVVVVTGASDAAILGNAIYGNGSLGIDLANNGVTSNDAGDGDSGANDLLNFPVITSAGESGGTATVEFDLDVPAGNYRVEFFTNTTADASGYGEGETLVHTEAISHPGGGSQSFTASFAGGAGDILTATATEDLGGGSYGSTSEFSAAVTVNSPPVAVDDSDTTNEDSGVSIDVVANDTDAEGDTLSVQSVTQGSNGSVVDNGDGTVTYTPDPNWNGVDTFSYTVSDGRGGTDTATVTVTVTAVNDAPVATDDADSIGEDGSSSVDVLANDSDVDGDTLSVQSVTQGVNGSVVDNGDGTVTYTPDPDWSGVDSYEYTVTDGALTDTATVTVTVAAVNDPPVAVDDNTGTSEDTPLTGSPLFNDSDVDGDTLTIQSVTQGANGSVVDNGDGTLTYTPDPDWNGTDSFTYTVTDGAATDVATVWVVVSPVNDAPVAVDDSDAIAEDGSSTVNVLANDSDIEGDTLSVVSVTQGSNGSVADNGDGTVTYTPDPDWNGTDSFTYTVSDGSLTDTASVTVTVGAANDPPVAAADSDAISEDGSSTVDVLANDSDVDGDTLSVQSVTQGANGSVVDNGDSTVTYTPDPNWNGVDTFTYTVSDGALTDTATVTVTVTAVNDFPTAADDADSIAEDNSSTVDVLANDSDVDGDTLFVLSIVQPPSGTVVDNGDGTVTYTPVADWNGVATFSYTVSDGALTDTASVTVTVTAVNDAPTAVDDSDAISEDGSSTVDVLADDSDVDGDTLSVQSVTQGANGTVVNNGDGTVTYTPDPDWNGVDTFAYTVTDGTATDTATVTVTVTAVNDFPVAADDADSIAEDNSSTVDVLANDSDVDGDTLFVLSIVQPPSGTVVDNGDGTVTYTPVADWNGVATFSYTVSDGALTDTASVTVTVTAVNDAPTAVDDSDAISEDGSSTVDVLADDSDVDGDILTIQSVTQGANGSVVDNGDGTVTYTPEPDWNGADSYTYTITDGVLTDTASVTVTVTAVNDAPVAVDDSDSIAEDGSSTVAVLANDSDVDGDGVSVLSVTQGSSGSVVINGDGTVTYMPAANWNGVDSYMYIVSDGILTDTATVTVTVTAVNDAPVAVDDSDSIAEDGSSTVDVLANDSDVEGDTLTVVSVTQGAGGSVVDNGDGTVTYTPNPDWNGIDSYTYTVSDGADSDTAVVTVAVGAVNDAPVAVDDSDAISEDGSSTVDVLANDSDVEGDTLTVQSVSQGANGSVVDNGDGTVTYTPNPDWNGSDSYTYIVTDGLLTDTAMVWVTVVAVNDAPVTVDDGDGIPEDGSSTVDVLANDSDVDGDTLIVQSVTQGSNGSVVVNGDGTVTYTPDPNWNGVDSYTYTVTDGALTDTATVTVTVGAVNDAPLAVDDSDGILEDASSTVDVLANDSDVEGDTLTVQSVTQGVNGSVVDNGDGTITYSPAADWNGVDSYAYTVTDGISTDTATVWVTVVAVNDAPVAVDDSDSISEDGSSTVDVLANDSDVEGDTLTIQSVTQGSNGTVVDNGDGTVTYTPDPDWNGVDTFTYTVSDGALTDTTMVTVTVAAVNDAPVAVDDSDSIAEDGSSTVNVLANDSDVEGDTLTMQSVTQGSNGSVVDNGDGTVTYTPNPDWNGVDTFTYTVSDGALTDTAMVTVTVTAVNDAPVAVDDSDGILEDGSSTVDVLANDSDVEGDTLTIQSVTQGSNGSVVDNGDGTVTYAPAPGWNGADSYTYTVSDGALTDTATVTVAVGAVNDPPVAFDDSDSISEDGTSTVDVLANDSDVEGDTLTIQSVTQGANGSVVDNGDGTVTYTPNPDWNGVDTFTYTVSDGALTDTATVTVTVTAVNDAPVAVDDLDSIAEDGSSTVDVLANDSDVEGDTLTIQSVTQGASGSVVDNGDGTVTYTPTGDWNGVDSYTYTVTDGALTDTATVTVTVISVNDAPVAVDDSDSISEDSTSTVGVLANDSDVEGDTLTVQSVTQGANGSVVDNGDGTVTYTPDADWNGVDSYTYTVTDGALTDTATVAVTVGAVNDFPTAIDDADSISEDATSTTDVLANDSDVDGDALFVLSIVQPVNGVVVDNGDGTVTYTPAADWNGVDSFTYTVSDGALTDTATVTVTVAAVNDAPMAVDDSDGIPEDASSTVDVLANDSDVEGDTLTVQSVTQGSNGSVVGNGDGTVTYTPNPDWSGLDSFTYTVTDGALTDTATVTVTVNAVNDLPVAVDDSVSVNEDNPVTLDVLANDSDVDGDTLFILSVVQPADGAVVDNGDGTLTYTPDPDWNGIAAFSYTVSDGALTDTATVTVTVISVNDAPVAVDDSDSISEDSTSTVGVLANDSDVEGDTLTVQSVTQGASGSVVDNGDGTVTYTPNPDWNGVDSFTYTVSDGALTDTATVTVTVTAVNDAPVAFDDADSISEDGTSTVGVLANDSDVEGDTLTIQSVTQGANGSVVDNGDGTLTYTPNPDWNGVDTFTYTVSDGALTDTATVTVTVTAVNDAPVAFDDADSISEDGTSTVGVLANDSDVEGDTLTIQSVTQGANGSVVDNGDGTLTYTPNPDWNGVDTFTYTVSDGALTDTATVTVTVTAVNDAPVAVDDLDSIAEDGSSTVDVLANDSDVEGDTLTIQSVTQGVNGSVVDNGDGTVTYTPAADWNGVDTFTYTVSDGALTDTATVTVTVTAVNDAPVAVDDSDGILEDDSSTVDVLANDSDVEGDTLTVQSVTQGVNGSVVDNGDGTVTYTPDPDWNGVDSFTYTVSDGALTDTATVTVTVTAVNDAPVAVDDSDGILEDDSSTVDVLANDSDVEGDTLTIQSVTQGVNGSVVDNGDGTVTYTPTGDWNGVDSYTYTVTDGAATAVGTVTITVVPVNDAPVAADDGASTNEDTAVLVPVLLNDSDIDGDVVSIQSVTQGADGSVVDNGDGTITYTPDADFNGIDSFTYMISDGAGGLDTASVTVGVGAINDAPVAGDDVASGAEDTSVTVDVLANDSDVDGDVLTVASLTAPANGTLVDNGDGTITYTPDPDWNGTDSFGYTVSDGVATATASVTVTIAPVNDFPVAAADATSVVEDGVVTADVLANDVDVDGDTLFVLSIVQPPNGSVTDNGDGTVTYTPNPDWNGLDSFAYTVFDGALTDTAIVTVTVSAVNDAPIAIDDGASGVEDQPATFSVIGNDVDVDGDALSVVNLTQPANGVATDNGDGTVTYNPATDWNGSDSFTYTVSDGVLTDTGSVTMTVAAVNDAPTATDDATTIAEDMATIIDVVGNDTDVDGDPLWLASGTASGAGTVSVFGATTLRYTPAPNFTGVETISYTVTDGSLSTVGTLTITVLPVNDSVVAVDDSAAVNEDGSVSIAVLVNDIDVDGDSLSIVSFTQPSHGSVTQQSATSLRYTPVADYFGSDSFRYTVSDGASAAVGTVLLAVNPVPDPPVARADLASTPEDTAVTIDVLANDSDVDGDPLSVRSTSSEVNGFTEIISGSIVRFTPAADFSGRASFRYVLTDGRSTAQAQVTIDVSPVNDPPAMAPATFTVDDTAPLGSVIGQVVAIDPEGQTISYLGGGGGVLVDPSTGLLLVQGDLTAGDIISFPVTATDSAGAAAVAEARVIVMQGNRPPTVRNQTVELADDFPAGDVVTAMSGTDADGDRLTWSIGARRGWSIDADSGVVRAGALPDVGESMRIPVTATDEDGLSATGYLTVVVVAADPDNTPPVAKPDRISVDEDGAVVIVPTQNDEDADGDPLSLTLLANPTNGRIDVDGDALLYRPGRNWFGQETISYRITDGRGGSASSVITIDVRSVNDAPIVGHLSVEVPAGQTSDIGLPPVVDVDDDGLTLELIQPENASVELLSESVVRFTPEADFEGPAPFQLTATDPSGARGIGDILVEVGVGKSSVSVEVLAAELEDSETTSLEEAARLASPTGLALFMPTVGEAVRAVWATRIPLLALLGLLALSLIGSRRLHVQLGTKPVPLTGAGRRTWSVVLVQEGQSLPVFAGPDRTHEVVARLHPLRCDLVGTGEIAQTGGVIWIEVDVEGAVGWIEANHAVANPTDALPMETVAGVLERLAGAVRGEKGLDGVLSGRGLYVAHHAPPFRLTRKRATAAVVDPTPFRWWAPTDDRPTLRGPFGEVVVSSLLDAMVRSAYFELPHDPEPGEVLYEFTNFEQVALGTREDGWVMFFERGIDGVPLLVGLMKRGALNPAALDLLTR